jgi:ankyrin repeat protein
VKILVNCIDNNSSEYYYYYCNTPLINSAANGRLEVVRVFLENGGNVGNTNKYRRTALHKAALNGHLEVCRLLLD